jgi:hypothetical protein
VQRVSDSNLPQVAHALHGFCRSLGPSKRGQKHCGKNRDDGDHDQQLDQGETSPNAKWLGTLTHATYY